MSYGSKNEKVALDRLMEWLSENCLCADLPFYVDEPGSWIPGNMQYIAGSPDGVIYECLDILPDGSYLCRRSLLEIKTPWKLRARTIGQPFYGTYIQKNGITSGVPCSYFDQIQGNMHIMGLGHTIFLVLSPSGYRVTVVPYDAAYCNDLLMPALEGFWLNVLRPGLETLPCLSDFGCLPDELIKQLQKRKT